MLQLPFSVYNIYSCPTIQSDYYCCQPDSNHILCNFSTKFHSSNLIIVLTFPFLLCLYPPYPPSIPAKRLPVCDALSFKPRHPPTRRINHTLTLSLFQNATIPSLPYQLPHSFIHCFMTNHFYSINLSLKTNMVYHNSGG